MSGVFIFSLDFELAWGTRTQAIDSRHAEGVERTHEVVYRLLECFQEYGFSATWATVGHLMLSPDDQSAIQECRYAPAPHPPWFKGDWFDGIPSGAEPDTDRYYAPSLVRAIVDCPTHQELASHTFSHPILTEEECPPNVARHELEECQRIARSYGREITSLVFPRNLMGHLPLVAATGHDCIRGEFNEWYWFNAQRKALGGGTVGGPRRMLCRFGRFVDEWLATRPSVGQTRIVQGLCEIPHGMFFPGSVGLSRYVPSNRLARKAIKGLDEAVRTKKIFSLFTHPHNLAGKMDRDLGAIERIVRHATELRDRGKLTIRTMSEQAANTLEATEKGRICA